MNKKGAVITQWYMTMRWSELEKQEIRVGFHPDFLKHGVRRVISIHPFNPPHLCLTGASGSGKTYCETILLDRLLMSKAEVFMADFKGIDFRYLHGCGHFSQHMDVGHTLDQAVDLMNQRMAGDVPVSHPVYLFFDEWAAYLAMLPKKDAESAKQKLSSLLMLGRGAGVCVILALQRIDAYNFGSSRENLGSSLALGSLSREARQMLVPDPDHRELLLPQGRGRGYLITDGKAPVPVVIPKIRDVDGMRRRIRCAMEEEDKRFPVE